MIKRSEWENDLQDLLFGDRQDTAIEKKRVHWAESIQVFELEEHEGTEELYREERDKEKEGQIRNDNEQTVNCKTRVSSSSLDPAPIKENVPSFLHQLDASIGLESEFEVPFPSRPTFKFEPETSEEEFSFLHKKDQNGGSRIPRNITTNETGSHITRLFEIYFLFPSSITYQIRT